MIPYGRQDITDADIAGVIEVLNSDFLTQGPVVPRLEQALCDYTGVKHAYLVNSATSALHIACMAIGLGPGDVLWTTPNTFVASANCAIYCGADVDFVDIDPDTWNLCPEALAQKLAIAESDGKLPKVVVPVHFGGEPCDLSAIHALSKRYGFKIIEDASHAIGASYGASKIGACEFSDITVFSFHPVKIITTAEGGAALTNEPALAEKLNIYRTHGVTREESLMQGPSDGGWYYQMVDLGYNYRMTELQAALGLSQIARLDDYIGRRHAIAKRYDECFFGLPFQSQSRSQKAVSALHLYPITLNDDCDVSRREFFDQLREAGIGVNVHYIPVHLQPFYVRRGFEKGAFPNAENYYARAVSLPMFPTLTETDQDQVVAVVGDALGV